MKKIYGEEEGMAIPVTKLLISKGLRKYVEEDKFGIYKKIKKIPWLYRLEYNRCKKHRVLLINYHFEKLDNLTEIDKIERKNLLRQG